MKRAMPNGTAKGSFEVGIARAVPPVFGAQSLALFPSGKADVVVLKQLPLTGSWCLERQMLCERREWLEYPRANPGDFLSTRWH